MSLRYEWILSLSLRLDTPESFRAELRYHLGHATGPPAGRTLDCDPPAFVRGSVPAFARPVHQDADSGRRQGRPGPDRAGMAGPMVATEGWLGFAREEPAGEPWMSFYSQNRAAHLGGPGEKVRSGP